MSFTYDLFSSDPNALRISKVRLNLGDKVSGSGPFPDSSNFSDEELTQILLQESNDVMRAVAACCETLANAWSSIGDVRVGSRDEGLGSRAAQFADRAKALRERYGGQAMVVSSGWTRVDGYQDASTGTDYRIARRNIHSW